MPTPFDIVKTSTPRVSGKRHTMCRFCGAPVTNSVVDLGRAAAVATASLAEAFSPLHAMAYDRCLLVRLETDVPRGTGSSLYRFRSYCDGFAYSARNSRAPGATTWPKYMKDYLDTLA